MVYRFFVYLGWRCGLNRRGEEMYGISSNKKLREEGGCRYFGLVVWGFSVEEKGREWISLGFEGVERTRGRDGSLSPDQAH